MRGLSLVLARLCESDKGVLTQISIALGTLAKLVQEVLKMLVLASVSTPFPRKTRIPFAVRGEFARARE